MDEWVESVEVAQRSLDYEGQSDFEEIAQLLALMKGEDIHDIRRLLERKIMENPARRAKISPKTDVKLEDIGSHLQLYRRPNFSGLTHRVTAADFCNL